MQISLAEARVERTRQRLAASDESPPPPPSVSVVFFPVLLCFGHILLDDLFYIANFDQHIFRFEVGVNDAAFAMKIVQAKKYLLRDLFYKGHWDAAVVPALDETKKILAQHFKDHADMVAVWTFVMKRVKKAHDVSAARVVLICIDNALKELDLIECGFGVVRGRTDDLKRNMFSGVVVSREPDGGEMAPAEFLNDCISAVVVLLANLYGVVAAFAVVFGVLFVGSVCVRVVGGRGGG